ncbi:electron transfer flavoprotein subunit beta/FixA family protein [Amphritea sp. 2_MG-2023]|uniref:electron transfer flavoprotein subunit beta/FixA family protein n=1 Tax=Amphritea TaxID=515417 RepID=UPI001C073C34|nr:MULTISPECIES: electron transfer flavoprotein subunit beta/FixA family protein [Amphritea]MBU2967298.1 electron transfer flavoprotein subunit beta/FixA family protein [Amphritea atlantica]MDO6420446.1 electron transfer flavoprotein subunit beta/FixA family protein [Amphritea sp. 2_MG-2023]MDX2421693.1 electron transfer flavoprotein subunit beta/FixA family protein [Amphritea sp.]
MKILVMVKRVSDPNVIIRVNADNSAVDLNNVKMAINPFCEIAVEEAVRLKEAGVASEVIALSIGESQSQDQLRTALAIGADRALLIESEEALEPLAVAKLTAKVVAEEEIGLVLLGKQSIDTDNGQTGQMLASIMGVAQGTFTSKLEVSGEKVNLTREVDSGLQSISLTLPAVISCDLRLNEPRFASLPNIMKAKRKPLETKAAADFGVDLAPHIKTLKVEEPNTRQAGVVLSSVAELVEKLNIEKEAV